MMQRHRSVYRTTFSGIHSLPRDVTIYNAFPEIDTTVKGAYYLPMVDGLYISRDLKGINMESRLLHEGIHKMVAYVASTCEQRYLTYYFLAVFLDYINNPRIKLLIPSFIPTQDTTVFLPRNLSPEMAEKLNSLFCTTSMIQEIIAGTVQARTEGWDREKTKRIIMEDTAQVSEQLLDEFLQVYDHIGMLNALLLSRYALNVFNITREQALERFQRAVQVAREFKCENGDLWEFFPLQGI